MNTSLAPSTAPTLLSPSGPSASKANEPRPAHHRAGAPTHEKEGLSWMRLFVVRSGEHFSGHEPVDGPTDALRSRFDVSGQSRPLFHF